MDSSTIHDNICSLVHKKCHPKSYHSNIKYHITLNIIFSVVIIFVTIVCGEVSSSQTWSRAIREKIWNWKHFLHWCRLHWMIFFIDGIAWDDINCYGEIRGPDEPTLQNDMWMCTQVILNPFFYLWCFAHKWCLSITTSFYTCVFTNNLWSCG